MIQNLSWFMYYLKDSSKGPFMFYSCSYGAVHCSKILGINDYSFIILPTINWDIPSHFDAFLDFLWISAAFQDVGWSFLFLFSSLGVPFCILAFFCTITGWECNGGKLCSSTFIFMSSKQWEGALLWCMNLVIVSWLTDLGFYVILQEMEDRLFLKDQFTQITKINK